MLPWLLLILVALLALPFAGDVARLWWGKAKPYIVGGGTAAKNAFTGKVAVALIAFAVGCFAPTAYAWVRDHGWTWPTIPVIVTPAPPPAPVKPTAVVYVYEKDNGGVPSPVSVALDKLNRKGILATTFEEDTIDGQGEVPQQYQVPLKAAQEAGLPALVATNGDKVLRVVKQPKSETEVLGACPMNSFAPINPALVDVVLPPSGYPAALAAQDTQDNLKAMCGAASRDFPAALWIEPKDWADKARENDKNHTWPANYIDRFTNQNPNHFCTCHSLGTNFEACRNRQRGLIYPDGAKKDFRYQESATSGSVWVSPMSIYAEANPREWGGASIVHVMEIGIKRGFLPDKLQPRDYGFKHTLTGTTGKGGMNQSSGAWTPVSRFPEGWQETAKHFRILEVIFPDNAEQVMCLILHGYSVCVGRNGHAVPYTFANVEQKSIAYNDSYEIVRWDSWNTVRGCANGSYAICSVATPDNWESPAN